jgi:hypothetical protein
MSYSLYIKNVQLEVGTQSTSYEMSKSIATSDVSIPQADIEHTNPAGNFHNNAETNVTMEIFREELSASAFLYNQSTLVSEIIEYEDIESNVNNSTFAEIQTNNKSDVVTYLPVLNENEIVDGKPKLFIQKPKNYGFHKSFSSFRGNNK